MTKNDWLFKVVDILLSKWVFPIFLIIAIGIGVLVADWIYGDWRCAFAECRIIK